MNDYSATSNQSRPGRPRNTSLPYVPIDPRIDEHPKTQALIDRLSGHTVIPDAYLVEVVQKLIKAAGRRHSNGVLGNLSSRGLARLCLWDGDPDLLHNALIETGWVTHDGVSYTLHDWADYGGQVEAKRAAWRDNKAKQREAKAAKRRTKPRPKRVSEDSFNVELSSGHLPDVFSNSREIRTNAQKTASDAIFGDGDNEHQLRASNEGQRTVNTTQSELSSGHLPDVLEMSALEGEVKGEFKRTDSRTRAGYSPTEVKPPLFAPLGCHRHAVNSGLPKAQPKGSTKPLSEMDAYATLSGGEVESILDSHGLLRGVADGSMAALVPLCPIAVWELRESLPLCQGKARPVSYLAGVLKNKRLENKGPTQSGARPHGCNSAQSASRGPTIDEMRATHTQAWVDALKRANLDPGAFAENVARGAEGGPPSDDDMLAMRQAEGSPDRYREILMQQSYMAELTRNELARWVSGEHGAAYRVGHTPDGSPH